MIRRLLSLLAASSCLMAVSLAAQSGFGVVGGMTRSHMVDEGNTTSDNPRTGFALGLSYAHPLSGNIQFAPELLYIQKGFGIRYGTSTFGPTVSFVELPLLLRASFGSAKAQPFVLGGLAPAIKVSCTYNSSDGSTSGSTKCATGPAVDTRFKRFDLGAMFGAGLSYTRYSVSVRYDLGLVNTVTDNDVTITSKNRSLMLLGGVSF